MTNNHCLDVSRMLWFGGQFHEHTYASVEITACFDDTMNGNKTMFTIMPVASVVKCITTVCMFFRRGKI